MLKSTLLFLSEREGLKNLLFRLPFSRNAATRFVAGDVSTDALAVACELNDKGFRVTLDLLGESVSDRAEAELATAEYEESVSEIDDSDAVSTISLKLTQLGLDIDRDLCFENLLRIVRKADQLGNFVRIDMESSAHTEATLDVFYRVFEQYSNVGIVIQSYLHRSEVDIARLVELGAPVRLCKGAYKEPAIVAYQNKEEVDASFVRLMKMLLDGGAPTAIATHDERMIEATIAHVDRTDKSVADFEFQMLYGVRRELQRKLVSDGYGMRIYVPYGSQWYAYFMRRMAERPANLLFVMRAAFGD
jgi:proline dehydrogenase